MNNLLLTLAMAALGQLGGFGSGPGPMQGYGSGLPGYGPGMPGYGPGMGFAPGLVGGPGRAYPIGPGNGFGGGMGPGYPGRGPVVVLPQPLPMPGGGYGGGYRGYGGRGGYGAPGGFVPQAPTPAGPQPLPGSEAEAFGLAPYR